MFPFDRMIRMMDHWTKQHPGQEVFAQIGGGCYEPKHMPWRRILAPNEYKQIVRSCRLMVAHAGTGSVFTASEFKIPIVLIPRRAANKEHTTDHQVDTAKWLEGKSGIFIVWSDDELALVIKRAREGEQDLHLLVPQSAPAPFLERIRGFLLSE
jgi:UDP-N-acetylglucosamine transferase subunit ALG13